MAQEERWYLTHQLDLLKGLATVNKEVFDLTLVDTHDTQQEVSRSAQRQRHVWFRDSIWAEDGSELGVALALGLSRVGFHVYVRVIMGLRLTD